MSNIDQIDSVNVNLHNRAKSRQQPEQQPEPEQPSDTKSKRPKNTALKQQRLPAWQPILTASTVLPLFFIVGVVFIVIGAVLLHYSNTINEYVLDYTQCQSDQQAGQTCAAFVANRSTTQCTCTLSFQLNTMYEKPVYIYYGLTNFYQNHRRYVKSRDDNQLLGTLETPSSISSDCSPFDSFNSSIVYAPCGAIANSLFNDTFQITYNGVNNDSNIPLQVFDTGIAWNSDKTVKFGVPSNWNNTVKPPNWPQPAYNLSSDPSNTGYKNEDFIVWMRTAALPNFRKFHRRVDHSQTNFTAGIPSGYYTVVVNYNYPVTIFDGTKQLIVSTVNWLGGKNPFLGIAYLVIGGMCIVLGAVFLVVHLMYGKKINEEYNALKTISEVTH